MSGLKCCTYQPLHLWIVINDDATTDVTGGLHFANISIDVRVLGAAIRSSSLSSGWCRRYAVIAWLCNKQDRVTNHRTELITLAPTAWVSVTHLPRSGRCRSSIQYGTRRFTGREAKSMLEEWKGLARHG